MTQKQVLLDHFLNGGTLTPIEALEKYNCLSLSQRAGELRRAGWPIDRDMVKTATGKRVACYYYRVLFAA